MGNWHHKTLICLFAERPTSQFIEKLVQGVQRLILILQSAVADRNKQVEFDLKVPQKSWDVDIYGNVKQISLSQKPLRYDPF